MRLCNMIPSGTGNPALHDPMRGGVSPPQDRFDLLSRIEQQPRANTSLAVRVDEMDGPAAGGYVAKDAVHGNEQYTHGREPGERGVTR